MNWIKKLKEIQHKIRHLKKNIIPDMEKNFLKNLHLFSKKLLLRNLLQIF